MSTQLIDPFFEDVGKFLGVAPAEIRLRQSKIPGEFTLVGPPPNLAKPLPQLPQVHNYCFTFVIKIQPPRYLCDAYRREYDQLIEQLAVLVQAQAWDEVAAVAQRLSELENAIQNTCRVGERTITYCVFPTDWFEDPLAGGRTPLQKPPIPPLAPQR